MEIHELSTEELVERAILESRLGSLAPETRHEICVRFSYHQIPRKDRELLKKLAGEITIPLPPCAVLKPPGGWPPPPTYYKNQILTGIPTDVFLSRPSIVTDQYTNGLHRMYERLGELKIRPRTIGISDTPLRSPFSEVENLIRQCKGMIVLGYPQFELIDGTFRGSKLRPGTFLPSEWHQIEGCLAYSRKIPTLVIAHDGIDRGIFALGSADVFIHQTDLSMADWIDSEEIQKALDEFRRRII